MARRKKRKAKGAPQAAPERSSASTDGKPGDERPPAPWGNFPLTQLSVLAGLVLIVIGLISGDPALLLGGLLLGSLGGLELSIREHFAGYRSHTTLLAAVAAVAVALITWFAIGLPFAVSVGLAAGAFVLLFLVLRQAFVRASGGLAYKIR